VLGAGRAIGTAVRVDPAWPAAAAPATDPPATDPPATDPPPTEPPATDPPATDPPIPARLGAGGQVGVVMPLVGPGAVATAVGADLREVRAALDPLWPPPPALAPRATTGGRV
jgi:hypothetical protein